MSSTQMLTTNALAVKLWERNVWIQTMQRACLGHAFNRGAVYYPKELMGKDAKGDYVTFPYVGKLTNVPIGEGGTSDGNEESLYLTSFNMAMNVSRIPVLNPNTDTIEQQRTYVDFASNTAKSLRNRVVELMDTSFFIQLAGINPTTYTINGTTYSNAAQLSHIEGHNPTIAPTSQRIVRAGSATTDQGLTSSDKMTLDLIDYALELNDRSDQPIERLGGNTFDLYVSPEQLVDLQQDSTGKIQWFNIELAKITGGKSNELETGWDNGMIVAGKYRDVFIYSAPRVAYGTRSDTNAVITTVRRAVLTGQDALSFASPFGGRVTDTDVPVKYFSQLKDYDYYKGEEARLLYGMKKMSPANKQDIGTMVISTYAAAHA